VEKIKLTTKESALLELLMLNAGNVVTKGRIMEKIWGYNSDVDFSCIEVYIHRLRKKLNISNIMTVRKIGYCLRKDKNV
jgi:DNA-binding response OmpR family regulator